MDEKPWRDRPLKVFQPLARYETETGPNVLEERSFASLAGRKRVRHVTIYPDGTIREADHSVRIYTLTELARMLTRAGLNVEGCFGGTDGSPFTLESRRLAVLSQKP